MDAVLVLRFHISLSCHSSAHNKGHRTLVLEIIVLASGPQNNAMAAIVVREVPRPKGTYYCAIFAFTMRSSVPGATVSSTKRVIPCWLIFEPSSSTNAAREMSEN